MQLSRTAVTRLYNSSGVELITHASVAVLQSLTLEQTEPPAELWFFVFSLSTLGWQCEPVRSILLQMDVTIVYCHIELLFPTKCQRDG